ncbi:MAG: VTT domain-containing protein, partial [Myxococcota bacterium]
WVVGLGLVALLAVSLRHVDQLATALQWMDGLGWRGDVLFGLFYLVGTLAMLPGSLFEGGAGFLYGAALGIPIASVVGTGCATVSFLLGRTLLRDAVERRIAANPRLAAIDHAIGADGLRLVFLLRLSPLAPFNLLSSVLGATPVSVRHFVIGTAAGHFFPVCVFVWTGSTVASALDLAHGPSLPAWATWAGLALTVLATVGVSTFAKRALDQALAPPSG